VSKISALDGISARTLIDLRQVYQSFRDADRLMRRSYKGSMRFVERDHGEYLVRIVSRSQTGLGRRSPETEKMLADFTAGKVRTKERLAGLTRALNTQAAMAKAIGLGRVPRTVARVLRALDDADVLGHLRIVGTNALYAYEASAGVQVMADALATGDIDLLLDARRRLRIMVEDENERSILALLRKADDTFDRVQGRTFTVANKDGFQVDLIRAQPKAPWIKQPGEDPLRDGDLIPAPILGLQWLVNVPSLSAIVVDENGYPAPMLVPDPRNWMVHKAWLANQANREPVKKRRDRLQAEVVRDILLNHLTQYPLDEDFLQKLPRPLRAAAVPLLSVASDDEDEVPQPRW